MSVSLIPVQVQGLSAVSGALADGAPVAETTQAAILGGANVSVSGAAPDMEALLAKLRMETNEARLNAALSRLSSALMQIASLSEEHKAKVDEVKSAGEELIAAEEIRDADRADFEKKNVKLDKAKSTLDDAKDDLKSAERNVFDSQAEYDSAVAARDQYRNSGGELNFGHLASLEQAVANAKVNLDKAQRELASANDSVKAAQNDYDKAKASRDEAMKKYEASEAVANEKRSKFETLLDSLDMSSRAALCEALRLDASDIDHLHDEIEEDDKKHSLSVSRSVEDVISDSLKRLDGELVDEIEDRHLDHV